MECMNAKYRSEGHVLSFYEQIGTEKLTENEEKELTEKIEKETMRKKLIKNSNMVIFIKCTHTKMPY